MPGQAIHVLLLCCYYYFHVVMHAYQILLPDIIFILFGFILPQIAEINFAEVNKRRQEVQVSSRNLKFEPIWSYSYIHISSLIGPNQVEIVS